MKMTFEINTDNLKDISDAVKMLRAYAPKNNVLIEDVKYQEEIELLDSKDLLDESSSQNTLVDELESKIKSLQSDILLIENENSKLLSENVSLKKEISNYQSVNDISTEVVVEDVNHLDDILATLDQVNNAPLDNEVIEEYERKISELEKNVEFHKNRSNKNFEEVQRLRSFIDGSSIEKRNLEKEITELKLKLETFETLEGNKTSECDIEQIKKENQELMDKVEAFEKTKEKLKKEIDFQKNRSKTNWEELKTLKASFDEVKQENCKLQAKIEELSVNKDKINIKEDINKLKSELILTKKEYEETISELRLTNDKLQNELDLHKGNFSEEDKKELDLLRAIKRTFCSGKNGLAIWTEIESNIIK